MKLYKVCLLAILILISFYSFASPQNEKYIAQKNTKIDSLPMACSKSEEIEKIIDEAISLGAPIYNEGLHLACYRIYEWAAYKIIYVYGADCKNVETVLTAAVDKSHGDYSDTEKAWLMRAAFDKVIGVPTQTTEPEDKSLLKKG